MDKKKNQPWTRDQLLMLLQLIVAIITLILILIRY